MGDKLLVIEDLAVYYFTRAGVIKAVDGVSIEMDRGEVLGLVGESGCGKSTLGYAIIRLIPPPGRIVSGRILFHGENLVEKSEEEMRDLRGRRISMIFQDPMTSLNPVMKIKDHIVETLMVHGYEDEQKALDRARELVEMLGIEPSRLEDYPHQLSGGMRQRIAIALAIALNPDLVIADEPTTALDVIVQAQILELLKDLRKKYNLSFVFITHDLGVAAELVDKVAVMYCGKIVEYASTDRLFVEPLHPYTRGLLRSVPNVLMEKWDLSPIPGTLPNPADPPPGCRFHPRCPHATDRCRREEPKLMDVGGTKVACFLYQ